MTELYVHVSLIVLDGKSVWVSINVVEYTNDEAMLRCQNHQGERRMLYKRGDDVRCFNCIAWGNIKLRQGFINVGKQDHSLTG